MNRIVSRMGRAALGLLLCLGVVDLPLHAVSWFPLGPYGGDARSLTADLRDPHHLYLGTATGWIYESHDSGQSWKRLAQIEGRNDLVIDHIITDSLNPRRLMVGAWIPEQPGGGVFVSDNAGKDWYAQAEMHGQAVLSLTRSTSDPNTLVAGTLRGVFRSEDDGTHWQQISPASSTEIHEVESVAIDPADPGVIYVGTWHLPWKTSDGGAHWENIKRGIIDDSDVFSIIVDPKQPKIVYASACSGIYKSVDAAAEFKKIQGIPSTARRTRKLTQDSKALDTVYAGTTEGLYRTLDAGEHWDRMTAQDVIVNDVWVDPTDDSHILLATDRYGVLSSGDMATTFKPSNTGFSSRLVDSYAADPNNQAVLYVGVVNDKAAGGVFRSHDGGVKWEQISAGLGGQDAFSLGVTADGTLLAGTGHGIFRWSDGEWSDSSSLLAAPERKPHARVAAGPGAAPTKTHQAASKLHPASSKPSAAAPKAHAAAPKAHAAAPKAHADAPKAHATAPDPHAATTRLDAAVYALVPVGTETFAATSQGLLRSDPDGKTWQPVASLQMADTRYLAGSKGLLVAAGLKEIALSSDDGTTWKAIAAPSGLTQITAVAMDDLQHLWAGGLQGLFSSSDGGASWTQAPNLSVTSVDSLYFDPVGERILLTSERSDFVYAVHVPDGKVNYWNTGWKLRFARPVGDHLVAASLFDGIVVQPRMVDSSLPGAKTDVAQQ